MYHLKVLIFQRYPYIVEDIGKTGKGKAKQELKGLQWSDCHKQNQLQTMQWWQPACIKKSLSRRPKENLVSCSRQHTSK